MRMECKFGSRCKYTHVAKSLVANNPKVCMKWIYDSCPYEEDCNEMHKKL